MVKKLYWEDAYTKEFDATVTAVDGKMVALDRTAFYPASGGQLNDMGTILAGSVEYKVIDVKEENDDVWHAIRPEGLKVGDHAECMIDWGRRYALMRYHTSLHMLCAVVEGRYQGSWKGGMIYTDKSHVDFDLPSLNKELAERIITETNAVIKEGHKVYSRFITQQEALSNPTLAKTEPGKELIRKLETVRVVEIENFDIQMDGGTHVGDTVEIGELKLSEFDNKGSHRKRVGFVLQ